jgi:hypothetical protein
MICTPTKTESSTVGISKHYKPKKKNVEKLKKLIKKIEKNGN